jgi:hypothetical protein
LTKKEGEKGSMGEGEKFSINLLDKLIYPGLGYTLR